MKFTITNWITLEEMFVLEGESWDAAFCSAVKRGVKFDQANLSKKEFIGIAVDCKNSSFNQARFEESKFERSEFKNACMNDCEFRGSTMEHCKFYSCAFKNADFKKFQAIHSDFKDSDFERSRFNEVAFRNVVFEVPKFYSTKFDGVLFENTNFSRGFFSDCQFNDCKIDATKFMECVLDGLEFDGKKVVGSHPFFNISPVGSGFLRILAISTDQGIHVQCGIFNGSLDKFKELELDYGDENLKDIRLIAQTIESHFDIWKNQPYEFYK